MKLTEIGLFGLLCACICFSSMLDVTPTNFMSNKIAGDTWIECLDESFCFEKFGYNYYVLNGTVWDMHRYTPLNTSYTSYTHSFIGGVVDDDYYVLFQSRSYYLVSPPESVDHQTSQLVGITIDANGSVLSSTILTSYAGIHSNYDLGTNYGDCSSEGDLFFCSYPIMIHPSTDVMNMRGYGLRGYLYGDGIPTDTTIYTNAYTINYTSRVKTGYFDDKFWSAVVTSDIKLDVEDEPNSVMISVGNITINGTIDTSVTSGGVGLAGSIPRLSLLYENTADNVFRVDVVTNINQPSGYLGQAAQTLYSSDWTSFDCVYMVDNPLCAVVKSETNNWWIYQMLSANYGYSEDINLWYYFSQRAKKLMHRTGTMVYDVTGNMGLLHHGFSFNQSSITSFSPVYLYGRLSDGNLAPSSAFSCDEEGEVCLIDTTNAEWSVVSYNLNGCLEDVCAPVVPNGVYTVGYKDSNGEFVTCESSFTVSADADNSYTLYTDGENCNSYGVISGYKLRTYGKYGLFNLNVSDTILPFAVKNIGTGDNELFDCTLTVNGTTTLNSSYDWFYGIERSDGGYTERDYLESFTLLGTAEENGVHHGLLSCMGTPDSKYFNWNVLNVSGDGAAEITVLRDDIQYGRVNLIKIRFSQVDNLTNLNEGVCYLTVSSDAWSSTFPMYLTTSSYCSQISHLIGGSGCSACDSEGLNCYYYSVINLNNTYSYLNNSFITNYTCYDADYYATSEGNVTFESPNLHYLHAETWDYANREVDTLLETGNSQKDKFKFIGYATESADNNTRRIYEQMSCTLQYEVCTISGNSYQKQWRIVDLTLATTKLGMVYDSGWLLTSDLCNGKNVTYLNESMPDAARVIFDCKASGEMFVRYDGTYEARVQSYDIADAGNLVGIGTTVSEPFGRIISSIFDVLYFIGGLLMNVMLSHLLETILLGAVFILLVPFIRGGV
jgi:hypothetical protein